MGYTHETHSSRRLCCDRCGQPGGVRKRTCPYRVLGNSLRGPRIALPYCPAPALCADWPNKHTATNAVQRP